MQNPHIDPDKQYNVKMSGAQVEAFLTLITMVRYSDLPRQTRKVGPALDALGDSLAYEQIPS